MINLILTFSILGFFQSIGSDLANGLHWLYNETLGQAINFITGGVGSAALSGIQYFFVQATTAFLSLFGDIIGYVDSLFIGLGNSEVQLAQSLGIFGPVLAILMLFGTAVVIFIVLKVLIDLV